MSRSTADAISLAEHWQLSIVNIEIWKSKTGRKKLPCPFNLFFFLGKKIYVFYNDKNKLQQICILCFGFSLRNSGPTTSVRYIFLKSYEYHQHIYIYNNLYTIWDRSVWIFIDVKFDSIFYRYPDQWRFDLITSYCHVRSQCCNVYMYVNIEREETQRSREFHGKINLHITWEKIICETTQIHIKRLIVYIYMYSHEYGGEKCWIYAFDFQVFLEKYTIISISRFFCWFI